MKRIVIGLSGLLAAALVTGEAGAATNLVTNGGFETVATDSSGKPLTTTSRQASSADGATQYIADWYNGSDNAKAYYSYGSGGEAAYTFLVINGGTTSSIGVNGGGSLALWGQTKDSSHPNQISNGFSVDKLAANGGGNFIASDGAYQAGPLTQEINNLAVGKVYKLSFDWAAAQQYNFNGDTTEGWAVAFTGANGIQIANTPTVTNKEHAFTPWSSVSYYFTATDASEYLSFFAKGGPSGGQPPFSLLDNVSMIETPEPASWMTMILGFGFVGAAMRRRGSAAAIA